MGPALLVCRVILAAVFVLAGAAKLGDLAGSRQAVRDFGVPESLSGAVGAALPIAELLAGIALVPLFSARFGALAAAVLLLGFCVAIGNAIAHGRAPDCHCFGQVHSEPAGWRTLARNCLLLVLAAFAAIGGWHSAGVSATRWVTQVSTPWLVVILAGVVILALVAFQIWFSLQLLSQNGRALGRIEALESLLAGVVEQLGIDPAAALAPQPLGAGLSNGGLPVGVPAPAFELDAVDGERYSLASLLEPGVPLLLIFSDAGCGPCEALMPDIAGWQHQYQELLTIAVLASGDHDRNRAKARDHELELVLLQPERQVSDLYQSHGTPMALVIGTDGTVASPTVGGAEAISTLVGQATRPMLAVQQIPAGNGHPGNGVPAAAAPPDSSRVGEPAPKLELTDLDGKRVALADAYGERTLALFWNPGCGFCQRMLEDLKAFERTPPPDAPALLVIAAGDPEATRAQQIHSRVLFDADSAAATAFEAHGTPMGVLVENGLIASGVAVGADAVLALARSR